MSMLKCPEYAKNVPDARGFFQNIFLIVEDLQYNKIYPDEKVRHTLLCTLRMVIRIFQPQTDRKLRMLQPEPEKHYSYGKRA